MTLSTIICGYIYAGYLALKATLEAGLLYAKAIITTLDSFVMSVENMIRNSCLVILDSALSGYQILCKYLTDWIMQKTHAKEYLDKFCQSLFKCSYILKELLNPTSPITKTLVKNFNYNSEPQTQLYNVVTSYEQFRNQICSSGFTFMWGLGYLRDFGESILAQINEWVDIITRNRKRIKKRLENYYYAIEDFGIMTYLRHLSVFFNCVLDATIDNCASIATSQNFYKKCTGALHIVEVGSGQYKLTDSWIKQKLGLCDNVTRELNGLSNKLAAAISDAGITSKNLANAQAAFNLANFVRDTKRAIDRGNLSQIPGVKLAITAWTEAGNFGNAVAACMSKIANQISSEIINLSFDDILENLFVTSTGVVYNDGIHNAIDLNDELGVTQSDLTTIYYTVSTSNEATAKDTINRLYLTDDHRLVSNAYIVDELVNGTNANIIDEITTKASIVEDLSDITNVVKKY